MRNLRFFVGFGPVPFDGTGDIPYITQLICAECGENTELGGIIVPSSFDILDFYFDDG